MSTYTSKLKSMGEDDEEEEEDEDDTDDITADIRFRTTAGKRHKVAE